MGEWSRGTYYDVLGVPESASAADIESAYRRRIKAVHPDRNDATDAADQFRLVRRAREVLADPDERARYDRLGHGEYVETTLGSRWRAAPDRTERSTEGASTGGADSQRSGARSGPVGGGAAAATGTTTGTTTGTASETRDASAAASDSAAAGGGSSADTWHEDTWGAEGVGTAADGGTAARKRARTRRRGAADWQQDPRAQAASGGSAYAVRREHATAQPRPSVGLSSSRSMLALATFIVYPGLLYSSVAPTFPLWVNVVVFLCTLFAVAAILTDPEVGMLAFGGWLFAGPFALTVAGVGVLSIPGGAFLLACLVPFALAAGLQFFVTS